MKRIHRLLLNAALLMFAVVAFPTPANAQADSPIPLDQAYCAQTYSGVENLSLDDERLDQSIDRLEELGYNPRILMLDQITSRGRPNEEESDEVDKQLRNESWATTQALVESCQELRIGSVKDPNLILMAVGIDERFTFFNWGEALNPLLGTFEEPRVQFAVDASGAEFRNADFSGGAAVGLSVIADELQPIDPTAVSQELCSKQATNIDGLSLESATLDNEMAKLEELGYNPRLVVVDRMTTFGDSGGSRSLRSRVYQNAQLFSESLVNSCEEMLVGSSKDPKLILAVYSTSEDILVYNWGSGLDEWMGDYGSSNADFARDAAGRDMANGYYVDGAVAGFAAIYEKITYVPWYETVPWGAIFMWLGFIALAAIVLLFALRLWRKRAARLAYLRDVREAVTSVNLAYYGLNERLAEPGERFSGDLFFSIEVLADQLAPDEVLPLREQFELARAQLREVDIIRLGTLEELAENSGQITELEELERFMHDSLAQVETATATADALEREIEAIRLKIKEVKKLAQGSAAARQAAVSAIADARGLGYFTTSLEERVKQADVRVGHGVKAQGTNHISRAHDEFSAADAAYRAIRLEADHLQTRHNGLQERTAELRELYLIRKEQVRQGRAVSDRLDADYNPETWYPVRGNGRESESRLELASGNFDLIDEQLSMATQGFDEAEVNLDQIDTWLSEIDSFMRSMASMLDDLDEIRSTINQQLTDVKAELADTADYVRERQVTLRRANVDDAIDELLTQQGLLDDIEARLGQPQPHYLDLAAELNHIDGYLDELTEEVTDVYDRVRSTERRLKTTRSSAKTRIDRAREYIEDHDSDVDQDARSKLRSARRNYESRGYRDGMSLAEMLVLITALENAERDAKKAQNMAESDHSDAVRDRSWDYSSSSSSGSSWSTGIGGGGGSSFGGFGGGGGGGFSVGGGGGGGGSW